MFSMVVKQVFNFADGRTVLAGPVEGDGARIQPGRYGLNQGDRLLREAEVEGEMIPKVRSPLRAERAVSVAQEIGLPSGEPPESLILAPLS